MADENQMDQGPAVSPQAEEKAGSGVTHPREAAEDLRSAAGASADKHLARAEGVMAMTRAIASAVFRTTASNTSARTRRKRSLRRSGLVSYSLSSLSANPYKDSRNCETQSKHDMLLCVNQGHGNSKSTGMLVT